VPPNEVGSLTEEEKTMDTRIVLAEPEALCREGIRRVVESRLGLRVVAEAQDGREAVCAAAEHKPDLVLVELAMPGMSGIEAIHQICENGSSRCIALASRHTVSQVRNALLAGACAFVPKGSSPDELLAAIGAVRSGRSYLPQGIADDVVHVIRSKGDVAIRNDSLTARQLEVLRLIAKGLSTKQIALELGIAPKTAETHRQALMERLGVHKASGLVRFAIREGMVAA
jgi:DNA-binding NarL/FixJ family response regulator